MIYPMYSIRDKQVGFMQPVLDRSEGSAIRNFAKAVNQPDSLYDFSPKDFDLFLVGKYDDQTGLIEPVNPPAFVVAAGSLIGVKYEE